MLLAPILLLSHAWRATLSSPYNRAGVNNQWIANWVEGNKSKFWIHDTDNTVVGNRVIGKPLWICAGSGTAADVAAGVNVAYIAAEDTLVAGNNGPLGIGFNYTSSNYDDVPAKGTRVEAHVTGNGCGQGSITCSNESGTTFSATTSSTVPAAFKLTPAEVGPNAPTAPRP